MLKAFPKIPVGWPSSTGGGWIWAYRHFFGGSNGLEEWCSSILALCVCVLECRLVVCESRASTHPRLPLYTPATTYRAPE